MRSIPLPSVKKTRQGLWKTLGNPVHLMLNYPLRPLSLPALALAPMAVRPEFQNLGIGSRLIREGLERCRNLGHKIVIVAGHPEYYPRFGFTSSRAKGLEAPFPVPDEAFMVIELIPGALDSVSGMIVYPAPFEGVKTNKSYEV
jgi:predicted N-acetyltransferase YhbS